MSKAYCAPPQSGPSPSGLCVIEFSDFVVPKTSGDILARLAAAGTPPILVHPERNPILQRNLPHWKAGSGHGICIQVTAQSLMGNFGRPAKTARSSSWSAAGSTF